jgi:hypothetical protein
MQKSIIVKLDDKEIEVKKLPIGQYAGLLKAVQELPKQIKSIESLNADSILEILPELIGSSLPDVIRIISIATELPEDEVAGMGLAEIVKLVEAIYTVNNYADVYEVIKKALAHPTVKEAMSKKAK